MAMKVYAPDVVIGWLEASGLTECEPVSIEGPSAVAAVIGRLV